MFRTVHETRFCILTQPGNSEVGRLTKRNCQGVTLDLDARQIIFKPITSRTQTLDLHRGELQKCPKHTCKHLFPIFTLMTSSTFRMQQIAAPTHVDLLAPCKHPPPPASVTWVLFIRILETQSPTGFSQSIIASSSGWEKGLQMTSARSDLG